MFRLIFFNLELPIIRVLEDLGYISNLLLRNLQTVPQITQCLFTSVLDELSEQELFQLLNRVVVLVGLLFLDPLLLGRFWEIFWLF